MVTVFPIQNIFMIITVFSLFLILSFPSLRVCMNEASKSIISYNALVHSKSDIENFEPLRDLHREHETRSTVECFNHCVLSDCKAFRYNRVHRRCQSYGRSEEDTGKLNVLPGWSVFIIQDKSGGRKENCASTNSREKCEANNGYMFLELACICIRLYRNPLIHSDAVVWCRADFSKLVKIDDKSKQREIVKFLGSQQRGNMDRVWIQGVETENGWQFESFAGIPKPPGGIRKASKCLSLSSRSGYWYSTPEMRRLPFICEKPLQE